MFSLNGNQGDRHDDVLTFFTPSLSPEAASVSHGGGHGRSETRSPRASADTAGLQGRHGWNGPQSIIAVTAKRETNNKVTEETRYFISSLDANDPKRLGV